MDRHRVSVLTLAREDIRALPRNGFALGALLVMLTGIAILSMFVYEGPSGIHTALIFFWLVAELVVGIVLAARVAAARRSRFVDSLYTTPLDQRTWLAAQVLVGLVLAASILLVQAPYVLLHVALVGVPADFGALLGAAVAMATFSVAFGLFCGVVIGESGPGAAASLAGGFAFLAFVLMIFHGIAISMPPTPMQAMLLRAGALSPLTLAMSAMGVSPFDAVPVAAWRPAFGLVAMIGGLSAAAWLAYTRTQGPLGWEPGRSRALVVACAAIALVVPIATAEVAFTAVEDDDDYVYDHGEHTQIAFVPRGAPVSDAAFTFKSFWDNNQLTARETAAYDVLVLLLAPEDASVSHVSVQVRGSDMVRVVGGGGLETTGPPAGHARPAQGFQEVSERPLRPVYRVPVDVRPAYTESILDSRESISVATTFVVEGRTYASESTMTFEVDVPGARGMLMAVGLPLPLVTLVALVRRKRSTR